MANAGHDQNSVPTITAVLNSNGLTITPIYANPSNHGLKINDASTGSDNGPANAKHDQNNIPTLVALSEADGTTEITLYADSSNNLLIDSN